jgi:DNA-damage-inducible protein D
MTANHRSIKDLYGREISRPNESEAELIFTALAEMSTRQIAETDQAVGKPKNKAAARKGGGIAKKARLELEQRTGKAVVSGSNFLPPKKNRLPKAGKRRI